MLQSFDQLRDPDFKLGGLQLWVHGRQFPRANDYWDGNWINVTAYCGANDTSVWTSGPIIHLSELAHFLEGMERVYSELKGEAELLCMEPELNVKLKAKIGGHLDCEVFITPNNILQEHRFLFEIDQSFLPAAIASCRKILSDYPIKDS